MKESALIIIKPDGIKKQLVGDVISRFLSLGLTMVAIKTVRVLRNQAEEHYRDIKGQSFFEGVIKYMLGEYHKQRQVIVMIFYGEGAIKKCRKMAGATNPEEASPISIRGAYGRITSKGLYENIVHVSSDKKQAKREIMLWFNPNEIVNSVYPTKVITKKNVKERVWA